jgi:hypothetical protein
MVTVSVPLTGCSVIHVAAQRVARSHEQVFEAGEGEFGNGHRKPSYQAHLPSGDGESQAKKNGTQKCRFLG